MTSDRDQALLWLNDHCGQGVTATVGVGVDGVTETLLEVGGVLRHWRQGEQAEAVADLDPTGRREDIIGVYRIGDAGLDLSRLPAAAVTSKWTISPMVEQTDAEHDPNRGVIVEFGDGIMLRVTEAPIEEAS